MAFADASQLITRILAPGSEKWLLIALCVTAASSLGYQAFNFVSHLDQQTPIKTVTTTVAKPPKLELKAKDLVQWQLFGEMNAAQAEELAPAAEELPETQLKLTLKGAFTSDIPEQASAVIEGADKKILVYHIKDKITGNVILEAVHTDRVVLKRNGKLESLYFPKPEKGIEDETDDETFEEEFEEPMEEDIEPEEDYDIPPPRPSQDSELSSDHSKRLSIRERLERLRAKRKNKATNE